MMKKTILGAIFLIAFPSLFAISFFKDRVFYGISDPDRVPQNDTVYIYHNFRIKSDIVEDRIDMESRDFEILKIEEKGDSVTLIHLHQPIVEIMELENGKMVLKEQKAHWIPEMIVLYKTKKKYVWGIYMDHNDGQGKFLYHHVIDSADVIKSKYPVDVMNYWLDDVDCGDCDKTIKWP